MILRILYLSSKIAEYKDTQFKKSKTAADIFQTSKTECIHPHMITLNLSANY